MVGLLSARGMTWLTQKGAECAVYFQSNNSPRNVLVVMLKMWNVMTIPLHKYAAPSCSAQHLVRSSNRLAPPLHGAHDDKIAEVSRCESGPQPVSGVRLIAHNECA